MPRRAPRTHPDRRARRQRRAREQAEARRPHARGRTARTQRRAQTRTQASTLTELAQLQVQLRELEEALQLLDAFRQMRRGGPRCVRLIALHLGEGIGAGERLLGGGEFGALVDQSACHAASFARRLATS